MYCQYGTQLRLHPELYRAHERAKLLDDLEGQPASSARHTARKGKEKMGLYSSPRESGKKTFLQWGADIISRLLSKLSMGQRRDSILLEKQHCVLVLDNIGLSEFLLQITALRFSIFSLILSADKEGPWRALWTMLSCLWCGSGVNRICKTISKENVNKGKS